MRLLLDRTGQGAWRPREGVGTERHRLTLRLFLVAHVWVEPMEGVLVLMCSLYAVFFPLCLSRPHGMRADY